MSGDHEIHGADGPADPLEGGTHSGIVGRHRVRVTVAELRFGVEKSKSAKLADLVEHFLERLSILDWDGKVTEFRMICIEVGTGRQIEARYPRLPAVRMNDTPFSGGGAWWSDDSRTAYFVDVERGEKAAHVVAFDVETG